MIPLQRLFALLCLSLLLAACGGGGGGGTPKPVAHAGADQTVEMGNTVTLDGSASSTSRSGATLSYTWTLVKKPDGSAAALSSATAQKPSFTADLPGAYEADLLVNDGTDSSEHDRVAIAVTNPDPVAIAPADQNVLIGTTVILDGSASLPPTGGDAAALIYEWTLVEKPAASNSALVGANTAKASLYPNAVGTYTATLVVRYADKVTEPLTVTITASNANTRPVANAGGPYTIERGKPLKLDGSASSDADGDRLSYRWYLFSPNETSGAGTASTWTRNGSALRVEDALVGFDTATPTLTPDVVGSWSAYLVVYDGTSISNFSTASITVTKPAGAVNTPPVASTFGTARVGFLEPGYISEAELSTTVYASGNSWDIDGDAVTRRYRWISTPAGFTQNDLSTATSFSFTPTVAGDYTWEMIVNDGQADSAPQLRTYTARTGANRAPVALVKVDSQTILMGGTAWFDGSGSTDADGNALTYHWKLIDKPDGSTATLQFADATRADGTVLKGARAGVVTDKPGIYLAALAVKDSHGVTSSMILLNYGRVLAKAQNNAPNIASISNDNNHQSFRRSNTHFNDSDQPYIVGGEPVTLYAQNAVDPDLDTLYYLWTLTQPSGSTLTDAGTLVNFTPGIPTVVGNYSVTALISDGIAASAPHTLRFNAVERANYPSLLLEDHYTAYPPNQWDRSIRLAGDFSRQRAFPYWDHADGSFPVFVSGLTTAGDYKVKNYRLTAFGGDYTIGNLSVGASTNTAYPGYSGKFVGLTSGQLIKKGESMEFSLVLTVPGGQGTTNTNNNLAEGIVFRFDVAEKPGWSFEYQPYMY